MAIVYRGLQKYDRNFKPFPKWLVKLMSLEMWGRLKEVGEAFGLSQGQRSVLQLGMG